MITCQKNLLCNFVLLNKPDQLYVPSETIVQDNRIIIKDNEIINKLDSTILGFLALALAFLLFTIEIFK